MDTKCSRCLYAFFRASRTAFDWRLLCSVSWFYLAHQNLIQPIANTSLDLLQIHIRSLRDFPTRLHQYTLSSRLMLLPSLPSLPPPLPSPTLFSCTAAAAAIDVVCALIRSLSRGKYDIIVRNRWDFPQGFSFLFSGFSFSYFSFFYFVFPLVFLCTFSFTLFSLIYFFSSSNQSPFLSSPPCHLANIRQATTKGRVPSRNRPIDGVRVSLTPLSPPLQSTPTPPFSETTSTESAHQFLWASRITR